LCLRKKVELSTKVSKQMIPQVTLGFELSRIKKRRILKRIIRRNKNKVRNQN